jgi:hypothetical protein
VVGVGLFSGKHGRGSYPVIRHCPTTEQIRDSSG